MARPLAATYPGAPMSANSSEPRLVLVTGGGKGIGRAVALRFAANGDRVVICGRDRAALEHVAKETARIEARACDVTDEAQVAALCKDLSADVLVNNAGIASSAPLAKQDLAEWNRLFAVNATGAFLPTRALLPRMKDRGRGRIVTVASTAGRVGYRYTAGYTAAKHAAVGLMRAVAAEVAGTGVTCNAVCPSFVRTEMTERSIANVMQKTGRGRDEALQGLLAWSPLGRLVEPEEVAHAVFFLASELAGAINGQTLVLDGGGIQT
jgi:NAD(P)-dependent dehydrogenase (short-subunit alcohol dehydrogenase family)